MPILFSLSIAVSLDLRLIMIEKERRVKGLEKFVEGDKSRAYGHGQDTFEKQTAFRLYPPREDSFVRKNQTARSSLG